MHRLKETMHHMALDPCNLRSLNRLSERIVLNNFDFSILVYGS